MHAFLAFAVVALTLGPAAPRPAAVTRNVLIVRGESPDLPGGAILVHSIEERLRGSETTPVEFYLETIDTGRFALDDYEERLTDLLASKYANVRLDLVIAL